jgi:RNA polymerase sigma-70 factor (ECF subfamily)
VAGATNAPATLIQDCVYSVPPSCADGIAVGRTAAAVVRGARVGRRNACGPKSLVGRERYNGRTIRPVSEDERELIARLRAGDEAAFMALVERYGPVMLRIALSHVRSRAVAEEVVQEAWLGVLTGLDRFEGRSSLKTWILRILTNQARTRGERERRSLPLSSLAGDGEPAVDPERFFGPDHPRYPGGWQAPPHEWPEERLLAAETLEKVREAIARLPARQLEVIVLRDIEGWDPEEVSDALGLSDGNQRVLLHRARSRVRGELEGYIDPVGVAA